MTDTAREPRGPRREGSGEGDEYGAPRALWRTVAEHPPPGIGRLQQWRSPLRGRWLTSVLGVVLLVGLPVVTLTGLLSYIAYAPQLGQARPGDVGWLHLPVFDWPTRPVWLFRANQGIHVILGLMLIPIVLAKLWSVIPKLFAWPPSRSIAQLLERISLLMLVGGILFEIATGVLNIQYDYLFGFSFYTAHYYGAWVFIAGFVAHVVLKLPLMLEGLRSRSLRTELRTSRADTVPEVADPADPESLVATDPAPATISRRGALAVVGGGSLLIGGLSIGQTFDGPLRSTALLLPRSRTGGTGANAFPVNRTAEAARITSDMVGSGWRLALRGPDGEIELDRDQLFDLPLQTATLPIACVEGWSTSQTWTGVRLRDLAAQVGAGESSQLMVSSLQENGSFNEAGLLANQAADPDSLLALQVGGEDLSLDHGFPARVIVPALPGVHNTKWVATLDFRGA